VFNVHGGKSTLASVWMPNHAWGLEILGEEIAMRPSRPSSSGYSLLPPPPRQQMIFKPDVIR
jgi:hypothetical protein